jgi:hypothetical protein
VSEDDLFDGLDDDDLEEERLDYCSACGGDPESGYDGCEFLGHPAYEPGPTGQRGRLGCPRMTGTF